MKGFMVGYFEPWSEDKNPLIVGYYTTWSKAFQIVKQEEKYNLEKCNGLREIYLVELEVNKTYTPKTGKDWIETFKYQIVRNHSGVSNLVNKYNNKTIPINFEVSEENENEDESWKQVKKKGKR